MAVTDPPVPVTIASTQVEEDDESFQVVGYRRNKYNRRFQAQQSQQYNGGGGNEFSNGRGKYYNGNGTHRGGGFNNSTHQQQQQHQHHQPHQKQQQQHNSQPPLQVKDVKETKETKDVKETKMIQTIPAPLPTVPVWQVISAKAPPQTPSKEAWNCNRIKLESNGSQASLAAKSSLDEWPALESAVDDAAESLTSLSLDCKIGQFDSSSTASVDSLDDDIDSPGKLCVEKWPLISNGDSMRSSNSAKKDVLSSLEPTQSSRQKHSSSDDTAGGNTSVSSDDTVAEVIRKNSTDEMPARKKKGTKLKWVPLKLTELTPKQRTKREKSSKYKNSRHERGDSPSRTAGRGRGRGGGGRGRGAGRGVRNSHQYFFSESSDPNTIPPPNHRDDYTDYPPDFTTLAPVFSEASEFIMPYVADNFYASSFVQPSVANATDSPTSAFPVGVEDSLLVELLKQQIEYYFSEENLAKDFYLRRKMDSEGYLPIKLIASFQRVQNMTHDYNNVVSAILSSEILEVKGDMSCVRTVLTPTKWPIADTLYLAVSPSEFLNPPVPSHV